ncbi:SurA N-terminal domain-containing protein [Sphingomonas piscis]|nr:SurA N-terminal domain-containing protein [Sphingomonas piscis]
MKSRFLLGLILVTTTLSGCQKKADGQTVAVVNNDEITSSELNAELAGANLPAGVDKKQATARVLQGLIDRKLVAQQARQEGIDRSPEFINRQRRVTEDLLIGMLTSRQLETGKIPTPAQIADIQSKQPQVFAKREAWKLEQLQYDTPKDPKVLAQVAQAKSLEQLSALLSQSSIPFQRGTNQLVTSVIPAEIYAKLVTLDPGEPFIVPAGNRSVASVIVARQPVPLPDSAARTQAVEMVRRQRASDLLQQRVKQLRTSAKIEYKEGYAPGK